MSEVKQALNAWINTLEAVRDDARAPAMRAYMKEHFPFLGVAAPVRKKLCVPLLRETKAWSASLVWNVTQALWQQDAREYQYCAIDLLDKNLRKLSPEIVPDLLKLAQQKSWWDSVDGLAGIVGAILQKHSAAAAPNMHAALIHEDFWLRRIAMLHQLGWREQVDPIRLFSYAVQLAPEREFFIRKAIGWALRDYAWYAPAEVHTFVHEHQEKFSGLTVREALKNLG